MSTTSVVHPDAAWQAIERERRRDRIVRRLSAVSWAVAFLAVLAFGAVVAGRVAHARRLAAVGAAMPSAPLEAAVPLVAVVGTLAVLVATLSTVAIFLRLRTASLVEIQLRLAALEDIVRSERDPAAR
jgi:hypothetical protein